MSQRHLEPVGGDPRRGKSRRSLLFVGGLVFGAAAWFAPALVLNSPLKSVLIAAAAGDFQGTIQVGAVSAGWLSPCTVRGIVIHDAAGERLAEAAVVKLNKSLLSLLINRGDLGTIRVQSPMLNLVLRPEGSNLEDALAPWLVPSDGPRSQIACTVEIEDGLIDVTDVAAGRRWLAEKLSGAVELPSDAAGPLSARLQTDLNTGNGAPARLAVQALWLRNAGASNDLGRGNLSLTAQAVPLEVATPLLRRFAGDLFLAGILTGEARLSWGETGESLQMNALAIQGLHAAAPTWLGPDQIQMQSVTAAGQIERRGSSWQIQPTTIESDLGRLQVSGATVLSGRSVAGAAGSLQEALRHGRFSVDGQLDLARLARMLPTTLRIRPGTHVATGQIALGFRSDSTPQGLRWDGRVAASDLSAMYEGRRITWEKPIVLTLSARDANGEVVFDNITCESSFLQLTARGTSTQGTATLQGDLSQLAAEVSRFIDLGGLQMAGRLQAQANWQPVDGRRIKLDGLGTAEQFQLATGSSQPWREERLTVTISGLAQPGTDLWRTVEQGEFHIESGADVLDVELLPATAGSVHARQWPLHLRLSGGLSTWLARLQPLGKLPGWDITGTARVTAEGTLSNDSVQLAQADVHLKDLRASNGSLFFNEPVVQIATSGSWRREDHSLISPETTLASSSLALRAHDLSARWTPSGWHYAGSASYRGDLARVAAWFQDPQQPAAQSLAGQATGQLRLGVQGNITSGQVSAEVSEFAYLTRDSQSTSAGNNGAAVPWSTTWQEPRIKLATTFAYDPQTDEVQLTQLEAAGETLSLAARGKLQQPATRRFAELDGQIAYDLQKVTARLRPQLGNAVQLAGQGTRPFSFRGPLASSPTPDTSQLHPVSITANRAATASAPSLLTEMVARASLGWTSAAIHGFDVSAGELDAQLADGTLKIAPLDLAVSDGRVRLAPELLLDRSPQLLTLAPGPMIEQVRISPQMCRTWFKYVAPLAADAAAAEGRFSVALQTAMLPVSDPSSGHVEGVLDVHQAQIGPGPLSQQLLTLAAQIRALAEGKVWDGRGLLDEQWLQLPPQRVGFRMAEQRVYHQGMQVTVKDVVIRTSGSVGMDQTLSLIAEVPLRDEWMGSNRYLQSLRGQSLRIPIQGTLSQPRLDQRALQQLTQQTVTGAATRVLQDEAGRQLQRGLEKLFGPPPPQ